MSPFRASQPPWGGESENANMLRQQIIMLETAQVLVRAPDDTIMYWNKAAEELYGFSSEEALGRVSHDLLRTEFPEPMEKVRAELAQTGHWRGELRQLRKDGSAVVVASHWVTHKDETGELAAVIESNADISALAAAEDARDLLAAIVQSSEDAILSRTLDGTINSWNPAAEKLFGFKAQEIIGQSIFRFVPEDLRDEEIGIIERLRKGLPAAHYQTVRLTKAGRRIDVSLTVSPVFDKFGRITGASKIIRDITESVRAQKALRDSEARKTAILASALDCILSMDDEGKIIEANQAVQRVFGYRPEEMIGQEMAALIIPERLREAHRRGLAHFLATGQGPVLGKRIELRALRRDGTEFPVELAISTLHYNERVCFTGTLRDITERKEAEAALEDALENLAEANRQLEARVEERTAALRETISELEAFSYSLSHDMRAPLRAITNFGKMLQQEFAQQLPPQGLEFLERIITAGARLDRLIQDVLAFTRISRDQLVIKPVDVEKLIRDAIRDRPNLQPPEAAIQIQSPLLPVLGDEASLTQCLINLLGNAVKFVAPGHKPVVRVWTEAVQSPKSKVQSPEPEVQSSKFKVQSSKAGASEHAACNTQRAAPLPPSCPQEEKTSPLVRLWIEDNGIGIPEDGREKIFDLFQRMHGGGLYEGSGMGLAIVRKAVERMGGAVGVESNEGKGSRFWVELRQG